ncbi:MAG: hypothetical protein AB1480_04120 [Nitrospirota bacterium]
MGHIRLGRLPKVKKWRQVIALLGTEQAEVSNIAKATVEAANDAFNNFNADPGLYYCYWLLTQITWHARSDSFSEILSSMGLDIRKEQSAIGFVSKVADFASLEIKKFRNQTVFTEIAQMSMREALLKVVSERSQNLFGTTPEDIRLALKSLSTTNQFGKLSRLFFSSFINRTLQFFISKEISNHVGPDKNFSDIGSLKNFNEELSSFCYQSAKIVEDFAGGWYSKRNWQGDITQDDAKNFIYVALKKLREELALEESTK